MRLEFHYGCATPGIDRTEAALKIGLLNAASGPGLESWNLADGVYHQSGDFHRVESEQYLVGAASVTVSPETLAAQTESLYDQLLLDHPEFSLYRIWHFVPEINRVPNNAIENYRAFCQGRAIAFERHANIALHSKIPAASAVGTPGAHLTLVYLAGKPLSTHKENPRQTPAYKYPKKYGPKSPTFARATTVDYHGRPTLFISGTASILASESVGETIDAQLTTTLENLELIAGQCPECAGESRRVRVYLRHADDFARVKARLEADYLQADDQVFYIVADICREELLLEIEVTIGL